MIRKPGQPNAVERYTDERLLRAAVEKQCEAEYERDVGAKWPFDPRFTLPKWPTAHDERSFARYEARAQSVFEQLRAALAAVEEIDASDRMPFVLIAESRVENRARWSCAKFLHKLNRSLRPIVERTPELKRGGKWKRPKLDRDMGRGGPSRARILASDAAKGRTIRTIAVASLLSGNMPPMRLREPGVTVAQVIQAEARRLRAFESKTKVAAPSPTKRKP